jgi:hypothetical protein
VTTQRQGIQPEKGRGKKGGSWESERTIATQTAKAETSKERGYYRQKERLTKVDTSEPSVTKVSWMDMCRGACLRLGLNV